LQQRGQHWDLGGAPTVGGQVPAESHSAAFAKRYNGQLQKTGQARLQLREGRAGVLVENRSRLSAGGHGARDGPRHALMASGTCRPCTRDVGRGGLRLVGAGSAATAQDERPQADPEPDRSEQDDGQLRRMATSGSDAQKFTYAVHGLPFAHEGAVAPGEVGDPTRVG
jgi:hypothetical protein